MKYVIDGGALSHRIPWERGTTFRCLMKKYTDYVKSRMEKPWLFLTGMTQLLPKIWPTNAVIKAKRVQKFPLPWTWIWKQRLISCSFHQQTTVHWLFGEGTVSIRLSSLPCEGRCRLTHCFEGCRSSKNHENCPGWWWYRSPGSLALSCRIAKFWPVLCTRIQEELKVSNLGYQKSEGQTWLTYLPSHTVDRV